MFSDMPHYRLPAATEGVRGVLEPRGLYKRRDTRDFVAKVFGLHESVGHCIEPGRGDIAESSGAWDRTAEVATIDGSDARAVPGGG